MKELETHKCGWYDRKVSINNYPKPDIKSIVNELTDLLNTVKTKKKDTVFLSEEQ